ncbi:hypothetical protein K504DRAFT_438267, partial [Pleomassaria siparia CBS 279.74]
MGLNNDNICTACVKIDKDLDEDEPYLFSAANNLDPGSVPSRLPPLTQIEEMLIARVQCFVEVRQVRGIQYKYRGHICNFLSNTAKVYNRLPLLPADLDIIILRPANSRDDPRMERQFRDNYRVRRNVIKEWLYYLRANHPGYHGITIDSESLEALPEDGDVENDFVTRELDAETVINRSNIDPNDAADDELVPDIGAIPDLHAENTELEILHAQLDAAGATVTVGRQPRRAAHISMPTPKRTPISEFNKSQALLS